MAGLHNAMAYDSEIKWSHWPRKPEVGISSFCITALSVRENEALVRRVSRKHTMTTPPWSERSAAYMAQFAIAHLCKRSVWWSSSFINRARKALEVKVEADIF